MTDRTTPETSVADAAVQPWRVVQMMPHSLGLWAVVTSDGMYVATRLSHEDAQMAAAAPDLLAALKLHVGKNGHTAGCLKARISPYSCSERCTATRAAIARAEGRAS